MMVDEIMNPENREHELDRLFVKYREACGSPEPNANFMPMLWQSIEARQSKGFFFEKIARTFVAGTLAACGVLALLLIMPGQQQSAFENGSYVEVIADADARESFLLIEPVRYDLGRSEYQSTNPR